MATPIRWKLLTLNQNNTSAFLRLGFEAPTLPIKYFRTAPSIVKTSFRRRCERRESHGRQVHQLRLGFASVERGPLLFSYVLAL